MIGKVINNNYRIMDEIGRGSVATVYLAKDMARNQVVALKIIHPDLTREGEFLRRFRQEAKLLARLDTPHAVRVFDYGEEDDLNFIVLEYVQGKTLAAILDEEGPLEVERALDLAKQIAGCLADTHEKGVVHRDLRPANVMVTAEGMVKVMDFGIAQGADLSRLSASGVLGSPHYLSPEQVEGREVDIRSDIYSLGVTLFEMLTGQRPYESESAVDIVTKLLKEPVPSVRALKEDVPAAVDALVKKCMAKDPAHRYPMPPDLIRAIDDILQVMGAPLGPSIGIEATLTGQTLGQYRLLEQIGRGGMATVYKGYQPALERYVAIKVLPTYLAHEPDFAARFEREAKSIARLNHPHILPVYDFGREGEISYIAMRYVEAGTLKEMLGEPLELERAVKLMAQVGAALDYAHRHGVVHRDVKPANILVDEEGWPLLGDFGLARMMEASVQLTKTGVGVGTPAYMSPEQGQGLRADERTDVYSLGVILYEMLTGRVPYEAETPMAVILKHITAPLPMPRQLNPKIPEAVERVILKAMAKAPKDRYQTAGEMVEALKRAVARAEVREVAVPPVEVAPAPKRRRGGLCLGVLVAAVLILVVAAGAVLLLTFPGPAELQSVPEKLVESLAGESSSARQARTFAKPILAAIAEREPDYSDDFSDPSSGWPVQSNARLETKYQEGAYSVLIKTADTGSGLLMDELRRFDDFVAQVDVRWVSGARGNVGFLWRFNEPDGPCYGGWIDPSQRWGMWNRSKTMDLGGGSSHIREGQEWNRLTLVVRGEDIALYVNDEPIAFASDDECRTGGVQFNVHAGEPGVKVLLDNFKVWDVSDLALASERPAPTLPSSSPDQASAFAGPILQALADRRPDYEDDFSDPGSGWPIDSTAAGDEWGYEDDAYFISATYLPQGGCCISVGPEPASSFSDFVLEVDARFVSGERGAWFVVFRDWQESGEQPVGAHYGVRFYPDGAFGIWKNVSGAHVDLVETDVPAPTFERGFETNHLTLVAQGPRIEVYVNGEPLWFVVHDESSNRGMISLGVENQTENTTLRVHFDNLRIWDISGLALPTQPDAVVTAEALNVRAGPGADHDHIGVVRQGDGLDVLAQTPAGDWLKVRAPDGTEGWVAAAYVTLNVALDEVAEAAEIPPPSSPPAPTPSPTAALPLETPTSPPSAGAGNATGRVLWNDEPFAGVVVKLCTDWSMIGGCKGAEYTAVSGADGHYTIADLPPGTYDVATQIPGQENETGWMGVKAEVRSGETAQVKDLAVVKYDLQLLSPHEEETVKTATPALAWAGYPHAAYYKVYLAPWGGGETVIQFEKTADTTYSVASPLQPGKYYWSIHAYNARGIKLAESTGHFTVAKD